MKANQRVHLLTFFLSIFQILAFSSWADARCAFAPPDAPLLYEEASFVFKLQYNPSAAATVDLPCPVEYHDPTSSDEFGYTIGETGFPAYTIVEVIKQDWSPYWMTAAADASITDAPVLVAGETTIAVIYSTDTGFQNHVPSYIRDDPLGFVAYVHPYRQCHSRNEPYQYPYEETTTENLLANPFLLDQCNQGNMGWSELSNQDRAFLESMATTTGGENAIEINNTSSGPDSTFNFTNNATNKPEVLGVSTSAFGDHDNADNYKDEGGEDEGLQVDGEIAILNEMMTSAATCRIYTKVPALALVALCISMIAAPW